MCHQVCFVVGSAGCFCCRRWTCGSSRRLSRRASFLAMPANTQLSLFFAKTAGKEPRRWSGPTQLPHTRAEQLKRIARWLLPNHGRARAKEPRHPISEEQAVLEIQARALGLLMAFERGGEGKLRLRDYDLVHFMTTATESQPKSRRFVVVKAICYRGRSYLRKRNPVRQPAAFFLGGRGPLDTQATPATSEATVHPDPGRPPHFSGGWTGRTRSATPPSGLRPSRHAPAPTAGRLAPATPSGAAPPPEPTLGGRT